MPGFHEPSVFIREEGKVYFPDISVKLCCAFKVERIIFLFAPVHGHNFNGFFIKLEIKGLHAALCAKGCDNRDNIIWFFVYIKGMLFGWYIEWHDRYSFLGGN